MILLFSDFGADGPYLGQMEAVLRREAPGIDIVNLLSDAPAADPLRSSYLLAALIHFCPEDSVFLAIVDPGVGGERLPVAMRAQGHWFLGPDNGLFNTIAVQANEADWYSVDWKPQSLSASFHGRDLFAPIAARIARGDFTWARSPYSGPDLAAWRHDLAEIIYVDHYGNSMTGIRHSQDLNGRILEAGGFRIPQAETFCQVEEGQAFWYGNSIGLIEIAVNRGRADRCLGLAPGTPVSFVKRGDTA